MILVQLSNLFYNIRKIFLGYSIIIDLQKFKENELSKLDKLTQKMKDTNVDEVFKTLMRQNKLFKVILGKLIVWIEDFSFDPEETIIYKIFEKINLEIMKTLNGFEEAIKHTIHKLVSSTIVNSFDIPPFFPHLLN